MKKTFAELLKRGSKMLSAIMDVIIAQAYESERPMLAAVWDYWRRGQQAESPIECAAMDTQRQKWLCDDDPKRLNPAQELIAKVALLLLEDVHPQGTQEGDDGN